jgi:hypothetical protein
MGKEPNSNSPRPPHSKPTQRRRSGISRTQRTLPKESRIIVVSTAAANPTHPLSCLIAGQRTRMRVEVIGRILARLTQARLSTHAQSKRSVR